MLYFKLFSQSILPLCQNKSLTGQTRCEKKKLSDYRAWTSCLGLQEFEAHRTARQSAHESGEFVSPTQRTPLPAGNTPDTLILLEADRPQGSSRGQKYYSFIQYSV